jgi:hypothetical protein
MGSGERDLRKVLMDLNPVLSPDRYAFEITVHPALHEETFALIREQEGVTVIHASAAGEWARISLGVHSSLDAVGLTAALSQVLADGGISANIVAALHHDHIFVPWKRRREALRLLQALA